MNTLHFLFGTTDRVTRKQYLSWGLGLMILKYVVEAIGVYLLTDQIYTPFNFLTPAFHQRFPGYDANMGLTSFYVLWSIPFIWIGVGMSLRRAVDAGKNPWLALLFFVPGVHFILMFALSYLPSKGTASWESSRNLVEETGLKTQLLISLSFICFGIVMAWVSVHFFRSYGSSLFVGAPVVLGFCQGYYLTNVSGLSIKKILRHLTITIILVHLGLLIFMLEGVFCLAMAFPIAWILSMIGGLFGHRIALFSTDKIRPMMLMALLPLTPGIEKNYFQAEPSVVLSSIDVSASPEKVWPNVVSFPDLDPTQDFFFRNGIATPLRARIEGTGVGAIRHCEFTTGSFVEPITVWDVPNHLAFDVKEQPAPMKELTFYEVIDAPHLKGFFRSIKGEFRLVRTPTGTKLEGRTWYEVEMGPQWYWKMFGEFFIHKIHLRVLGHIKKITEDSVI